MMNNEQQCMHCGRMGAELTVVIEYEGQSMEVHLCQECAAGFREFTGAMFAELRRQKIAAAAGGSGTRGQAHPFANFWSRASQAAAPAPEPPEQVLEALRTRRKLNALRRSLADAVQRERYEYAAQLRDQIEHLERKG